MPNSGNKVNDEKSSMEAWKYLEDRFGVDRKDLEGFQIKKISGDFWLCSKGLETDLETETEGFRLLRKTGRGLKPTTYALQFLSDRISKNIVKLSREEFLKLLRREEMVQRDFDLEEEGYVALKFDGQVVGCGFYMNGKVSSRVPKGRGKELAQVLDQ